MAENTAIAEKKETENRELVAKDFTEGIVVKVKQKEKFGLTFPKNYNYTNELMAAMLILQDAKDANKKPVLESCSRASIENALLEMVTNGLSMQSGQCYPIAFAGKLQCQKSVYGNTCKAREYGMVDIDAMCIYKGDEFVYHIENAKYVIDKHTQNFENIDNNNIIGAYAVAPMKDGTVKVEIMNMSMIKNAWSQGYGYKENGNGTHQKFTDQMCEKTVKNRLLKQIIRTHKSGESMDYEEVSHEEMLEQDVAYDIEQNANSVDFEESNIVEGEIVEQQEDDASLPPFMQAE